MKHYVAGFCFSESGQFVALVEKQKPEWQQGMFNAIGGKMEPGETSRHAMHREFHEETGVDVDSWQPTVVLFGAGWVVNFFRAFTNKVFEVRTMESEAVTVEKVSDALTMKTIPNLRWLIPMQLDNLQFPIEIRDLGGIEAMKPKEISG